MIIFIFANLIWIVLEMITSAIKKGILFYAEVLLLCCGLLAQNKSLHCRELFETAKKFYSEKGQYESREQFEEVFDCDDETVRREALNWLVEHSTGVFNVNGVKFKMVKVEGGTFLMGATIKQDKYADNDEKPVHHVTLSDYFIGQTEVTQELWQAVMGNNPSFFKCRNCPVEQISWEDCQAFLGKLRELTGLPFRLPTEAEWEYAARGGNKSRNYKYSGSNKIEEVAWCEANSNNRTHKVGTKVANELGLYDMNGNVAEWCNDWYGEYRDFPQMNPKGTEGKEQRVYRGRAWNYTGESMRISHRNCDYPKQASFNIGFRLAL